MAQGDITLHNPFKLALFNGGVNLANGQDVLKAILVSGYTPDIDNDAGYADVSADEYGAGSGYTVGGETLTSQATSQDSANDRAKFDADNVVWSGLGPLSPATPSHMILYDDTHGSDLNILNFELGTTATNGGDYTVAWHADGIILLT